MTPPHQVTERGKNSQPATQATRKWAAKCLPGFTLPELLIAVGIFSIIVTLVSSLYIDSFHESSRANLQNQIYEDARFILQRIVDEVRNGMIDYDEYYNQNVVIPTLAAGQVIPGSGFQNFGQNYGRYYSAFFHPGADEELGFNCNDGGDRNSRNCTPLRRTLDRHTGENPFIGKYTAASAEQENAFCGNVTYETAPRGSPSNEGTCGISSRAMHELYLISRNGRTKTILARERIGGSDDAPMFALSLLRMQGEDIDNDGTPDRFVCADEFECRGTDDVPEVGVEEADAPCRGGSTAALPTDVPRSRAVELNSAEMICDTRDIGFSRDFVPMSPFRVNITRLDFYISPAENPHYAFAETDSQEQPSVTVVLTVSPNSEYTGMNEAFIPFTLAETVPTLIVPSVPAPLLVQ